jgi:hypothetical protein
MKSDKIDIGYCLIAFSKMSSCFSNGSANKYHSFEAQHYYNVTFQNYNKIIISIIVHNYNI